MKTIRMSRLLEAIHQNALTRPDALALQAGDRSVSYAELVVLIETLAAQLTRYAPRVLGLLADNGIDWVLADLAALQAGIPVVPLPPYFSSSQLRHTIRSAGIDRVLTDQAADLPALTGVLAQNEGIFHGSLHGGRVEPSGREQVPVTLVIWTTMDISMSLVERRTCSSHPSAATCLPSG
jgi:long-chain acyl-CoA synthetase